MKIVELSETKEVTVGTLKRRIQRKDDYIEVLLLRINTLNQLVALAKRRSR